MLYHRDQRRRHRRLVAAIGLTIVGALSLAGTVDADHRQDTDVMWHPQQAAVHTGEVEGASATIWRDDDEIRFEFKARELTPGNVYTLWRVTVPNPSACASSPCTGNDVLLNPATGGQVGYAGGLRAGASGRGTFSGRLHTGPLDGWLADRMLDDGETAEVHFVVNDHGPMIPGRLPDMKNTYRGGCSDDSPFPGIFPPTALADGQPGPNECRLFQSAIFVP